MRARSDFVFSTHVYGSGGDGTLPPSNHHSLSRGRLSLRFTASSALKDEQPGGRGEISKEISKRYPLTFSTNIATNSLRTERE